MGLVVIGILTLFAGAALSLVGVWVVLLSVIVLAKAIWCIIWGKVLLVK